MTLLRLGRGIIIMKKYKRHWTGNLPKLGVSLAFALYSSSVFADVSYQGIYIALIVILSILLAPVIIMSLTYRTRKKLHLTIMCLWTIAVLTYLYLMSISMKEFLVIAIVSYVLLTIYFVKEKKEI